LTERNKNRIQEKYNIIINEKNDNIEIIEKNQLINSLFQDFKTKTEILKNNYIHYLKNENSCLNNKNKLKNLEKKVNIPQKREDLKNIYKDLIKFINNIYKNSPEKKINCYKKIIKYFKGYEKLNDGNTKIRKKINRNNINRNQSKSKLDIIKNDNNDNDNWQIINKRFNLFMIMGGVILPLCYLINFLNSNLK
jgi:hypothetical protein